MCSSSVFTFDIFYLMTLQDTLVSSNWWMTTGQGRSLWNWTVDWTSVVSLAPGTTLELASSKLGLHDFFLLVRYMCWLLYVYLSLSFCVPWRALYFTFSCDRMQYPSVIQVGFNQCRIGTWQKLKEWVIFCWNREPSMVFGEDSYLSCKIRSC